MSTRTVVCVLAIVAVLYLTWVDHNRIRSEVKAKVALENHQKIATTQKPFIKPDNFQYAKTFDAANDIPAFGTQTHPSQWMIPDS